MYTVAEKFGIFFCKLWHFIGSLLLLMTITLPPEKIKQYHDVIEDLGPDVMQQKLRSMHLIRAFEERIDQLYVMGKTYGTLHLAIGQEATNVGALAALTSGDYFFSHHRGHGHALAWTDDPNRVLADVLGKATGFSQGYGGTMHMADVANGFLGGNGIVGGSLPMSVGVGLSIQLRETAQVCLVFFGDGAANEGAFHEALNMAAIWDLPVIYVCENNQYAMSTPVDYAFKVNSIGARAQAYGIPGTTIDGNDFFEVYLTTRAAVDRARRGDGPALIDAVTYRIKGHSRSDRQAYRTRDEVRLWQQPDRDPIPRFAAILASAGVVSEQEASAFRDEALARVDAALEFVENSPEPDPHRIADNVYA
jgi:acetoin:2,6-dichlorophenolindophenol oxidoreductase subunit alpha